MPPAARSLPLPPSLWAATAEPAPATPPLAGDCRAEVAVVGGGYTGLSAALHIAAAGRAAVLVEAAEPGWGASGRNGGQVIAGMKYDPDELVGLFGAERGERLAALAGAAPDLVFSLIARHGIACDASRRGWIQPVHADSMLDLALRRVAQWAVRGAPVELLDRGQTAALLGTERYAGGWLDRRGGGLHPLSYARGLARAALNAGAAVHGASPAVRLSRADGHWRVETPGGAVTAPAVLICTNAYTGDLVPGLERTIVPVSSFQVATAPLDESLRRSILPQGHVASDTRRLLTYFRFDRDGRLLVGGRGAPGGEDDPGRYERLRRLPSRLFPQLGRPVWEYYWAGKVAITADHLPHIHEPEPGLAIAIGYNGRGVAMATMLGKLMAERALGAPADSLGLPVTRLRPLPFAGLRGAALAAATQYYRLRDWLD